jgi:hypothetical protein
MGRSSPTRDHAVPLGWVRNHTHWPSDWLRVIDSLQFQVERCIEQPMDLGAMALWAFRRPPISVETGTLAWGGLPAVLAWRLRKAVE